MKKKFSLIWLASLAFVLISSTAIHLNKPVKEPKVLAKFDYNGSRLPVLTNEQVIVPFVSAQGVVAIDLNSGITLYEKNKDSKLYPASTTKLMTALVALDEYNLDDIVEIPTISIVGQKMGLYAGERITVRNLLTGTLVYSANDAAEVLARINPEGRQHFVDLMNKKALELGLSNSHFNNPSGLDEEGHYSTAYDLYLLGFAASANPFISELVATEKTTVENVDKTYTHYLQNTNKLLGTVAGVRGLKTGWTEVARENLVTLVERDNHPLILVVLGSQDRFGETTELIEWIYANYTWRDPEEIIPFSES